MTLAFACPLFQCESVPVGDIFEASTTAESLMTLEQSLSRGRNEFAIFQDVSLV